MIKPHAQLAKVGACLNFAYFSLQFYNPDDPKGSGHGTMAPPNYAPVEIQGVHKVLHTFKILISQKPHMVETLDF